VDINGLKLINDSFGHEVGDSMLKTTAQIFRECSNDETTLARYGGDEFVFLIPGDSVPEVQSLLSCIEERSKEIRIESFRLSLSSGYAVREVGDESLQETLKRAEDNLQRNKIYESASAKNKSIGLVINSLFAKSPRELQHSRRVSALSVFLAQQLQLPESEVKRIRIAALLHDIGKIGINESILNKPTRLDQNEWEAVKRHPEIGYRILSASAEYNDLSLAVLEHH
jgi:diguanylate cyclase (GGDEF)-like protein/putative nucleotidyltransferase with HDIG domain